MTFDTIRRHVLCCIFERISDGLVHLRNTRVCVLLRFLCHESSTLKHNIIDRHNTHNKHNIIEVSQFTLCNEDLTFDLFNHVCNFVVSFTRMFILSRYVMFQNTSFHICVLRRPSSLLFDE